MPSTPSTPTATRAWLAVAMLFVVGFSNYLTRFMLVTMHGSIVASIPMNEKEFGLLSSIPLFVYAAISPVGGFWADRFGRSRVLILIMTVWCLTTCLSALARTFGQLLVMRSLMGLSEGCYLPAATALIVDYHRGPTRSLALGIHLVGTVVGGAVAGLGGWLAERVNWHFAFLIVGGPGLAYCLVLAFFLRDAPREGVAAAPAGGAVPGLDLGASLLTLVRNGRFLVAFAFWGLLGGLAYVVTGWMPVYLQEHFHLGQGAAGISANSYYFIPAILGFIIGGAWSDRWSRTNPRARAYVPFLGLLVAAPGFWFAAHFQVYSITIAALVVYALCNAFPAPNMMPMLCLITDARYRATAFGLMNMGSALAGSIAIYVGGWLRDEHIDLGRFLSLAGAMVAMCAFLPLVIVPRGARPAPAA